MTEVLGSPEQAHSHEIEAATDHAAAWGAQSDWALETPTAPETAFAEWTLDQIGAENEEIKNRCIDIVRKIDELTALKDHFVEISGWIGGILEAREKTQSALVERGMMMALAEGALADLKTENRDLYEAKEAALAENSLLTAENERLRTTTRGQEARIEALENELREANEASAQLRQDLDAERARGVHLKGEVDDLQLVVETNDAMISQLQLDLAAARDEVVFTRQHGEMLQTNLTESQTQVGKLQSELSETQMRASGLSEKIREMEIALDSERRQLAKLEELLAANQAEYQKAQTVWRAEKEEERRLFSELEAKAHELSTRAQAADGLLADVRAELQAKFDQCRAAERQAQELEQRLQRLTEQSETAAAEASQVKDRLEERERAHARLGKRARSLIRAMRDLSANLEKAEQKAKLSGDRLSAETSRFDSQKAQFEQTVRDLVEQLEKERVANRVTVAALEAARQQRQQPREEFKAVEPPKAAESPVRLEDAPRTPEAAPRVEVHA